MNAKAFIFFLSLFCALLTGCNSPKKQDVTGKWKMHKVVQSGTDVTNEHNPENDRFIVLSDDHTFKSGGSPMGENTGKYTYDQASAHLFLDSDVGENDDSHWYITLSGDSMLWQGVGTEWAEEFKLVFYRD